MILLGGAAFYCSLTGLISSVAFVHTWWARKCYCWKAEVTDSDCQIYPSLTPHDVTPFFRKVDNSPQHDNALHVSENPGIRVTEDQLTDDEQQMLMGEIRKWVRLYGQGLHPEKLVGMERELREANIDPSFLSETQFVSDRHEDPRPPRAPWGVGDGLQQDRLPVVVRALTRKVQETYPFIGDLRHVYVEYAPDGRWYRRPRPPHPFDGHDYVVIPLLRRKEIVTTLSPILRSQVSNGGEVAVNSWTSRDIDVACPTGSMVRIYGLGRHRWGFGIRPLQWFGNFDTRLEDYSFQHLEQTSKTSWQFWKKKEERASRESLTPEQKDEALVYLHFEGPVGPAEVRKRWTKPEHMAFGKAPAGGSYDKWDDEVPSEHMVQEEGVFFWVARNVRTMLAVS